MKRLLSKKVKVVGNPFSMRRETSHKENVNYESTTITERDRMMKKNTQHKDNEPT